MRKKTYISPEMSICNIHPCIVLSGSNIDIVSDDSNSTIDGIVIDDGGSTVIDSPGEIW